LGWQLSVILLMRQERLDDFVIATGEVRLSPVFAFIQTGVINGE